MTTLCSLFLKGLIIGFSIAAPVGPIGVLCIRRTLTQGLLVGVLSGLGAACADAVYGLIAGLGMTAVSTFLLAHNTLISFCGAFFLMYLGIKTLLDEPKDEAAAVREGSGLLGAFATTFFLTVTNPMTILSFAAIFAGAGAFAAADDYQLVSAIVLAVFIGSAAWWLLLCGVVSLMRTKVDTKIMRIINKLSGLIIIGFAIHILLSALK